MFDSVPGATTASWATFDTPRRDVKINENARFNDPKCVIAFQKRGLFKNAQEIQDAVTQVLSVDVGRKPRESLPYRLQFENLSVEYKVYEDMHVEVISVRPVLPEERLLTTSMR